MPKILVAEDAQDLLDAIVIILGELGYRIRTARDGVEATTVAREFEPDLVILDMRMPKMSGANACAEIRKTSDAPIIMFTSSNEAVEVRDAISKGATDFVLKSTGMSVLIERVKFHLAESEPPPGRKITHQKAAPDRAATTARPQGSPGGREQFRTTSLIVDPDETSRSVITGIFKRLDQNVIEVGTAAEAIKAFNQIRPDILITEWSLPDMDAFTMLGQLSPSRKGQKVLRLIVSARLSPEAHRKADFAGISNFIYKPLDPSRVEQVIADSVRQIRNNLKRNAAKAA